MKDKFNKTEALLMLMHARKRESKNEMIARKKSVFYSLA